MPEVGKEVTSSGGQFGGRLRVVMVVRVWVAREVAVPLGRMQWM